MKQTAVDWLEEFLKDRYTLMNSEAIFQHAKEMEKEQIRIEWEQGNLRKNLGRVLTFEDYYKQTYEQ